MPDPSSPPPAPIQAYYKLTFPNFEYYLQTLSVTIGRRPTDPPPNPSLDSAQSVEHNEPAVVKPEADQDQIPNSEEVALECLQTLARGIPAIADKVEEAPPPPSPHPSSSSSRPSRHSRRSLASSAFPHIDVDLGPLKSISRLHARIDYDDSIDKFVLYVNGRNGAWVDGAWVGCGGRVALGARTQIQIATRTFYFELPPSAQPIPVTPDTTPEADVDPTSADDPLQPPSPSTHKDLGNSSSSSAPSRKRRRLSHSVSRSQSPPVPRRRKPPASAPKLPSTPERPIPSLPIASPSHSLNEPRSSLPAAADGDSDDDQLVSINDLEQDDLDELEAMGPPSDYDDPKADGRGKAPGKVPKKAPRSKAPNKAGKGRLLKKPIKGLLAPPSVSASASNSKPPAPMRPLTSKKMVVEEPQDPSQPRQPKKYMTQRLIAKTQLQQAPRPPPDQMPPKPPYTYAVLCYRAINELGGKASLSEIVNWIRDKFEWYRWNDECGWESSVRHNLSSNPGFVKSRRDNEVEAIVQATGQQKKTKGFFWSIDPKAEESFAEKEREITEAGSRAKLQQKPRGPGTSGGAMPQVPTVELSLKPMVVGGIGAPTLKLVMPVPMMAPRGMGIQPPPPVGMMMNTGHHPHPHPHPQHMAPPPMIMHPPSTPIPVLTTTHPGPPSAPAFPPPPPTHPPSLPIHPSLAVPPPSSSIGQPAFPPALSDVCLSITVGPVPPGAPSDSPSSYVDGPPITLHNGSLILNPTIFAGLTKEQLDELQKLKAAKALEILTGYTKNFVKEQIVKKGKIKGKGKVGGKGIKVGSLEPTKPAGGDIIDSSPASTPAAPSQQLDSASILAIANLASASAGPAYQSTPSSAPPQPVTPSPAYPLIPPPGPHGAPTHSLPMPPPYGYYGAYHNPFTYSGAWPHPGVHASQPGGHFPQPWMHVPQGSAGQPPHHPPYVTLQTSHPSQPHVPVASSGNQPSLTAIVEGKDSEGPPTKKVELDEGVTVAKVVNA
ncbi:Pre-rRNA-processing protein fhl1 [Tulasnella sp. JGI-2019a]|nr:Pre-rRNA-processing protein fhl1 [Tulasnella sp. JGI-2019a]KAG8990131.1 Pre-rRNA-processing protein fhl1 [Tulasnella sp. JGI-2019a]